MYPRLGELLIAHRMSVAELERQIEQRFGLTVDAKTLYRLAHRQPIQRADMEVAGAAAAILGIGLDDLFEVQAVPIEEPEDGPDTALLPEQSRRLSELFDAQSRRGLTSDERQEIETLVADYGRRLHESRLQEIARKRGVTVEKARRQVAAQAGVWSGSGGGLTPFFW